MIEQVYAVFCEGHHGDDDCEMATDDWHYSEDEAVKYAAKHEKFHRTSDGKDYCDECFWNMQGDIIRAAEAETGMQVIWGKVDGHRTAACTCGDFFSTATPDETLLFDLVAHLKTHQQPVSS